ncbi:MAG: enoyl-CoA hydratase/isomerase family protein [Desulfobacterales bacterium]|nr:enoyl-CoA hydratase/isomerase family protein [Desulfobacterales bacterium]
MDYTNIIFKTEENIATITFNRPKALNALNTPLLNEFSNALDEIYKNEAIKVLILTGAGEKAFVAGADITELSKLNALQVKFFLKKGHEIIDKLQMLPIPVIAAINGFALGGGSEIALACDFIYASENSTFGLPEILLGIIPGFGGTQRLPRLVGKNIAKEMIFTGKMISGAEAEKIGMVNKICPKDKLMEEVLNTAKNLAAKGRVALRAAKEAINWGMNSDLATGCAFEIDTCALCVASEDAKEGLSAFLDKRIANFKGGLK